MTPPDNDDRTVFRVTSGPSDWAQDFVASAASSSMFGHTLAEGTRLGEFEIIGLIGEGGFGIVYLAYDPSLDRQVAVKEYMPASLASRASGAMTVAARSDRHVDTFKAGLRSFVNEARLLARFDHPALVKVYRFWEANGTAYMVMPYYEGPTLKHALAMMGRPPDEDLLRQWLGPLLDALTVMHAAKCFHRDIAPDNILLTATGPLLLDFGAARRVVGDMTHALTVVLKPGYAPIEQYGDSPSMTQGAWTDLYALACVVYYAVTGKTPMSSVERLMSDRLEPLSGLAAGRYSDGFLRAIDAALALRPQDRPQGVAQFRALLDAGRSPPIVAAPPAPLPAPSPPVAAPLPPAPVAPLPPPPVEPAAPIRARNKGPLFAAGGAALLAAAALAWTLQPAPALPPAAPAPLPERAPLPVAPAAPVTAEGMDDGGPPERIEPAALQAPPAPPPPAQPAPAARPVQRAAATPPAAPARSPDVAARCTDILQKASLEPLRSAEKEFLKRECR